ncbi:energy transducer TonB [Daejeonella sp.]|uniref:energy transducer TonB n=1 Tax=Daejeonella sp. TaxID=2805397 RepID=UPI0025BAC99D|nr:energy transducer TonB [Daejeonella sp.]
MKTIKLILLLFFITGMVDESFAIYLGWDKLVYNGKTFQIDRQPRQKLYGKSPSKHFLTLKENEIKEFDSTCSYYYAEWEIIDNQLYLTGIFSCYYRENGLKADLRKIFGKKFINGKVKADWVSANIFGHQGKMLVIVDMLTSIFEKNIEFQIEKGKLIGTKIHDNSKSKRSDYFEHRGKLIEFVYKNINWDTLPELNDKKIAVRVQYSANEYGIIDSAKIVSGEGGLFDKEAIRVIKSIPEWEVFYENGKHWRRTHSFEIIFNNERRKKYGENLRKVN